MESSSVSFMIGMYISLLVVMHTYALLLKLYCRGYLLASCRSATKRIFQNGTQIPNTLPPGNKRHHDVQAWK